MRFVKDNFKLLIGVLALMLVGFVFFMTMRPGDLEEGDLRAWLSAPVSRRGAAVEILTGSQEHSEIMVLCIDTIAGMPDSGKMRVRDAAALCAAGIALRDNDTRD